MLEYIKLSLNSLNESKLLMGFIMIILNVGSKYIDIGFSKTQEQVLRNGLARELLIFAVAFTATRDIVTSLLLTGAFMILSDVIFHENSKFCLIPTKMNKTKMLIDTDKDGIVSPEEEKNAMNTLKRAEKQRDRHLQGVFMSHFVANSSQF